MSTDAQQDAREQARHKASVMIAFAEGKAVRSRFKAYGAPWIDDHNPRWDFVAVEYEVKPEERKPRETILWVNDEDPSMRLLCPIFRPTSGAWRQATFREILPWENTGGRPQYTNVSCSECGMDFGPGDHGFSHCKDHQP